MRRIDSASQPIPPQRPAGKSPDPGPSEVTATVAAAGDKLQLSPVPHLDGRFKASDGQSIAYRQTVPAGEPKAIVVMQQGTLGQPQDFDLMGEALAASGIHSYALGARSEAEDYRQHAADLEQLVAIARQEHPGVPVTVMGVSLGAMIALDWSARHNDEHLPVVAMAPVVANRFLGLKDTARIAAGLVSDKAADARVNTPMSAGVPLTTNPRSQAAHLEHPERMTVPARLFGDVLKMSGEVALKGRHMTGPLFVALAGDDQVAVNGATHAFVRGIRSPERQVRTFANTAHDLSQETHRPELVAALRDWILAP